MRDGRFLVAVLVVNFLLVPLVVCGRVSTAAARGSPLLMLAQMALLPLYLLLFLGSDLAEVVDPAPFLVASQSGR